MKPSLEHLLSGVSKQIWNAGSLHAPSVSAAKDTGAGVLTQIDKTTAYAKRVLDDEAAALAEKTAQLKAAREDRDKSSNK